MVTPIKGTWDSALWTRSTPEQRTLKKRKHCSAPCILLHLQQSRRIHTPVLESPQASRRACEGEDFTALLSNQQHRWREDRQSINEETTKTEISE